MSIAINAGKVTRGDVFYIDPMQLIVNFEENIRRFPVPDARIEQLAREIATSAHGQIEPVIVRRVEDNRLKLIAGYTRYRAIVWANTYLGNKLLAPLKIKCVVQNFKTPEEAEAGSFFLALSENTGQNKMSPVDEAYLCRVLIDKYGLSPLEVAQKFGQTSPAWVTHRRLPLLQLPEDVQRRIHDDSSEDHITPSAGLLVSELTGGNAVAARELIDSASLVDVSDEPEQLPLSDSQRPVSDVGTSEPLAELGHILGAPVDYSAAAAAAPKKPAKKKAAAKKKALTRDSVMKAAREKGIAPAGKSRSMKEVASLFERIAAGPGENKYLRKIAAGFEEYRLGNLTDDEFEKILNRNVKSEG